MRDVLWAGVFGVSVLLGGCASRLDQKRLNQWLGPVQASRVALSPPLAENIGAPRSVEQQDSVPLPADAGPEDFVRLALERNPGIAAAEQKVLRLAQHVPQVTSLDDPMLMVSPIGEMAETAAGQVGTMTGVSQKLPFPGKLNARGRVATQEAAMAAAELDQVRLQVVSDTRRAYWSYYYSTQAIQITRENRDLLAQFRQIAESRFKTGAATEQDVLRASVELSNLDNELLTLGQRRDTAVAMLNSLLDRPVDAALPPPRAAVLNQLELQLNRLLSEALRDNPELEKVRQRIEGERQKLRLARLNRWPDLTIGANYNFVDDQGLAMSANGKDQWWISFGINLPVWFDKLDAAEREAHRGILEALADLKNTNDRVAFRVQDALARVQTQQRQVILFRDVIIPQARQTLDASSAGYRAGKLDFLTLVDNWRKLINFELVYQQNLSQLEQSLADLEQIVGHDVRREAAATTMPTTAPTSAPATSATQPGLR